MREFRVITDVWFAPGQGFDPRASMILSDETKIRLDPNDFKVKLRVNETTWTYPIDDNLYVRTRTYSPEAVRALEIIQVVGKFPPGTSVGLRIFDGTDEWWWDGTAWAVAISGDWNTEDEINQNLDTYDAVSTRSFAICLNLVTTDENVTPEVELVRVLWRGPVDWVTDLLVDSLVGMFRQEIRILVDFALPPLDVATAAIDLNSYQRDGKLRITGADAVFDHDADPNHLEDLLAAFDEGTQILTLSAPIPEGNRPFLRLFAGVEVAWDTAQDYQESPRSPAIILSDADTVRSSPYPTGSGASIVRRDTGEAVLEPSPYRMTYEIEMEIRTDGTIEQTRLFESVMSLLHAGPSSESGPFLRSRATDRRYRLNLLQEFRQVRRESDVPDLLTCRGTFRIEDAALNLRPAEDLFAVKRLRLGFSSVPADGATAANSTGAPVPRNPIDTIDVE